MYKVLICRAFHYRVKMYRLLYHQRPNGGFVVYFAQALISEKKTYYSFIAYTIIINLSKLKQHWKNLPCLRYRLQCCIFQRLVCTFRNIHPRLRPQIPHCWER